MKYNFDEVVDRSNSDCSKIENLKSIFGREDIIPLWVADMDFKSPPAITQALLKRVEHGVFGYTVQTEEYFNSITNWLLRCGFNIGRDNRRHCHSSDCFFKRHYWLCSGV